MYSTMIGLGIANLISESKQSDVGAIRLTGKTQALQA